MPIFHKLIWFFGVLKKAYNILWLKCLNVSVQNTFLTMSISALFLAGHSILDHIALNANELYWPRPSLPWGDEQTLNLSCKTG